MIYKAPKSIKNQGDDDTIIRYDSDVVHHTDLLCRQVPSCSSVLRNMSDHCLEILQLER